VEVTGEIGVSEDLTPHIAADKVVFLGRGTLPQPKHIPWDQLANGRMDAQWVEMQGVVRATDGAHLLLNCEGRQVTASLGAAADAVVNRLVDASIRIQGVALAALDDLGRTRGVHLLIPSLKFLEIESEPPAPFSQPKLPIQSLLRVGDAGGGAHRVRVEGVLTLQDGQRLFLQDDTGAAMAIFKQQVALDSQFGSSRWSFWRTPATPNVGGEKFLPGDRVEVVGFQDAHGYSPVLTEVLARKTGGTGTVTAQEITTNSFTDWKLDSYLVKLTGVVVGEQVLGEYRVLELRSLGRTLQAFLPVGAKLKEPLQPGTTLQVTGEKFAIAVGEIGAGDDRGRGAHAIQRFQQGDMDQTDSHQRESGNTEDRSDNNATLKDSGSLVHILTCRNRVPESGRWRCAPGCCSAARGSCRRPWPARW